MSSKKDKGVKTKPRPHEKKPVTRPQRASFQGLLLEGRKKKKNTCCKYLFQRRKTLDMIPLTILFPLYIANSQNEMQKNEEKKNDRRRKSLSIYQSSKIREIVNTTLEEVSASKVESEDSCEKRLQEVLTKAKSSGMSAEELFSFFTGGDKSTSQITREHFLHAVSKLGHSFSVLADDELEVILKKFDVNGDGFISIAEFKNYCYSIPSICWKAERMRLEQTGELDEIKNSLLKDTRKDEEEPYGKEVLRTSKFFWKVHSNVEIRIFHSVPHNAVTLQTYCQRDEKELPLLWISGDSVTSSISDSLEIEQNKGGENWKVIVDLLELKLQEEQILPYLKNVPLIEKPQNLANPPKIDSVCTLQQNFRQKMQSFKVKKRQVRESRRSVEGLTTSLLLGLEEALAVCDDGDFEGEQNHKR